MRTIGTLALSAILTLSLAAHSRGQDSATAVLTGRVTDRSGGLVRSAAIKATREGVGQAHEAKASHLSTYVLAALVPGRYHVTIEAPGFAPRSFSGVVITVGSRVTLDAVLDVAAASETVQVEERAIGGTSTSGVGGVISSNEIESLPLNGRNFLELAFLVPGNAPAPNFDPTKTNSVIVSSAGQLGRGGNVTMDGQDNNDDAVGGPLANLPQDAVQEFQISTNRFSAEQGRSAASAVNVVTKTGSDQLGGSLSFFMRDRSLQGLPATYDRSLGTNVPFDREQYGATLGGPLARGKAWWFGAVEYRKQSAVTEVGQRDPATQAIRHDFAPAPLDDLLATGRIDAQASPQDDVTFRYTFENAKDTGASTLDRAIGSASQRQSSHNRYNAALGSWTRTLSPTTVNVTRASYSDYQNDIAPVSTAPQLTFPSLQDGASFRVPQSTSQKRLELSDTTSLVRGNHTFKIGADVSRTTGAFDLGVFRQGRVELIQDFPQFDLNRDGVVNDQDLLFAVAIRSGKPNQDLLLDDCSSTYVATFVQDDWRIAPRLTLDLGLRWEMDTNVKNVSGYDAINPIVKPFLSGDRKPDANNFGPRVGFTWMNSGNSLQVHGGYGIYYDRVTLEVMSLERGLDGRALPIEVRAGNLSFLDPATGALAPGAPTLSHPFTGPIIPGAGASGINIIDNNLQNPTVQQWNLGTKVNLPGRATLGVDLVYDRGTHFIIGRTVGQVVNPVVGGPDSVVNLESSVGTRYTGLLTTLEKRWGHGEYVRASYTLSRARNYSNDDQIPFGAGPLDPNNLEKEYGPTPNERRHYLVLSGSLNLPARLQLSPIWTIASGVPMDILMPSGTTRVPTLPRNAGGTLFKTPAQLNAYIQQLNASGGVRGELLPLVSDSARFNDGFDALDVRLARSFAISSRDRVEIIAECFNVLNVTNILGVSKSNYSGFTNVLVRDSANPTDAGYLRSSSFGRPLTTAGGVFGSGGPRAFQLGARFVF